MEKIGLIKSTFLYEEETKKKLCDFIISAKTLSMGEQCKIFEENFSKKQNRKYSVFVSNGSCANLLLIQSLLNLGKLSLSDKIFVSSLTWSTNVMPIIQLGLIPIPLDVEKETLNVSSKTIIENFKLNPDVKGIFLTNALGFCSDIDKIKQFCEEKGLIFLEDNCESLGTIYQNKLLGNFSLASTFSFFVGHHLSTIEGGMICTDDEVLYEMLKLGRAHGWTRNNSESFKENLKGKGFGDDFYNLYTFYDLGYNLRPTEINGFIGNIQINYWEEITQKRKNNFKEFLESSLKNKDILDLNLNHIDFVSNFGFPVIFKDKETCEKYKKIFIENKIEIRPIIGGNISKQPFFKKWCNQKYSLENAEYIHENGFYFGNNPEMTFEEISRIKKTLENE